MKTLGVVFTERRRAALLELPPDTNPLGPHEVRGSTLATIVSAGTELAVYDGLHGGGYPAHPGYASVFRIEETGAEVSRAKAGDVVFSMDSHRSTQRVHEDNIVSVPAGLAPEKAVFARMMSVSMSTLTTTTARPPAKVVVTGLGLVGHLASQIFSSCGYRVIACDPVEARRKIAQQAGIATVREAVPVDDPEIADHVALAIECSGNEAGAFDCCKVVQKRGEVVLIGTPWRKRTDLTAFEIVHAIFHRYVVVRSGWEWELPVKPTDFRANSIMGNIAAAMEWIATDRVHVDGLYRLEPPSNAADAYAMLAAGACDRLAVVFDWAGMQSSG
jgi:threonine dehydrogenase-like Zn-dependent dehydrogenase